MYQKGFANIILVGTIIILVGGAIVCFYYFVKPEVSIQHSTTSPILPSAQTPTQTLSQPQAFQPSVSLLKDKDANKTAEEILKNKIDQSYKACIFDSAHNYGINGEKLCSVIQYLQENSRKMNYWVDKDSPVKKSNEGGAVAQVDIDLYFLGTKDDYNRFVENQTSGSSLSKSSAGGTLVQMSSSKIANDTFSVILSHSLNYEILTLKGNEVLKLQQNGKSNLIFVKSEVVYTFENINPLFEAQALEIIKIVLN